MKLFVEEDGTPAAQAAAADADSIASVRIALVEMRSALARMRAHTRISEQEYNWVVDEVRVFWRDLAIIELDAAVTHSAAHLAAAHVLRAYDAVHLAAALELRRFELQFACWDTALRAAANREGLALIPAAP